MSSTGNQGAGAKAAKAAVSELESMLSESPSSDRVCLKLAHILHVRRNEVALLRLEKGSLRFIFPPDRRLRRGRQRPALLFSRMLSCG
jgi:hypothetical protein